MQENHFLSKRWTSGTGTVITEMRKLFLLFSFFVSPLLIFAQEAPALAGENINVESSDSQMFNMDIDLKIQDGTTAEVVSDHKAHHKVLSGRPVVLNINGGNFKAAVRFTLYNKNSDNMVLLAQSTIAFIKDGHRQMMSTVKSIPITAGEKVLFFPLGVLNDGEKSGYNCMLEMEVSKYQQQPVSQE